MTSQYVYGKIWKITEIAECVTLRYGRQPICIPCGNADPGDHSGPTALRGINRIQKSRRTSNQGEEGGTTASLQRKEQTLIIIVKQNLEISNDKHLSNFN